MYDELDILREIGSTAAGHGSIALSEILGRKIVLEVPSVDIITYQETPKKLISKKLEIATFSKIYEGFPGGVVFILDAKNALKLVDLSCKIRIEEKKLSVLVEIGLSLIREIGSIIVGSYLDALGSMFRKVIIPSFPTLMSSTIDDILFLMFSLYGTDEYACLIETIFQESKEDIRGGFYLILSPEGFKEIRDACKSLLEERKK